MKILVTGGAGFIGSALIRQIIGFSGHSVINLDLLTYAGNLKSVESIADDSRYHFVQGDIADAAFVQNVFKEHQPDAVIHLAAESHVDRSIDSPSAFIQTNIVGSYILLEAALGYWKAMEVERQEKFRFLHVSTDEVYGDLGVGDDLFTEDTPYQPSSPYSASKAASDHLARAWHRTFALPVLITNCSNNYGPYQYPEKLIPVVIENALRGKPLPVYGEGNQIRDWLFVEDHAMALLRVLEKGELGRTYNVGGCNEMKNIDVVHGICDLLDKMQPRNDAVSYREQVSFVKDRPGHDVRYAIDASRIEHELGWTPQEDFESGLAKTVEWFVSNRDWSASLIGQEKEVARAGLQRSEVK